MTHLGLYDNKKSRWLRLWERVQTELTKLSVFDF